MNNYYLEHLTSLGEQEHVTAMEDIYNHDRVKLIAKGITINRLFLSTLLKHKLLKPIDHSISISNALTPGQLK
jgi:hypothetical protein